MLQLQYTIYIHAIIITLKLLLNLLVGFQLLMLIICVCSVKSSNTMAVDISAGSRPASSAFIGGVIITLAAIWQLWHLF